MQEKWQKQLRARTGQRAGIWLAMLFALLLHVGFLLLPIASQETPVEGIRNAIELQLTTISTPPASVSMPALQPEFLPPEKSPETDVQPPTDLVKEQPRADLQKQIDLKPETVEPVTVTAVQLARQPKPDLDKMSDQERARLTDTILARQYINEESAADRLFGKQPVDESTKTRKEFHYPARPGMIAMLDRPMQEIPFAYTPGLIHFAYDPGVKGDLHRFWDVITPEFGWRTKYGTVVKCKLILVIVGCGWK